MILHETTVCDVSNHSRSLKISLFSSVTGTKQRSICDCQLISSRGPFVVEIHLELALVLEVNSLDVADQPERKIVRYFTVHTIIQVMASITGHGQ